jgi:hypothetical protein
MYVYDLENCARENGFKVDDKWEVSLASDEEKVVIENKYNPTLAIKIAPTIAPELFTLVKEQLHQPKSEVEQAYTADTIKVNQLKYMIAFSAKKVRR